MCRLLVVGCWLLVGVCCLRFVDYCVVVAFVVSVVSVVFVASCSLFAMCWSVLFVVCCLLFVLCWCLLFVVC